MINKHQQLLTLIQTQVDKLTAEIAASPSKQVIEPLFDPQLFNAMPTSQGQPPNLQRHQQELIDNVSALKQRVEKGQIAQVNYLAEKIANQIAAIRRELATDNLRSPTVNQYQESPYDKHCRYLEYQRRLIAMKKAFEMDLSSASADTRQPLTQKLAALEGRLYRCHQAILKLEKQLDSDIVT
ncbi:primosomal replication protein PriC [Utexia brackfieldae]|uniref:primosomal replication protein PriC n=1 Tax=Utexia brackfieldae TaxID=3074108 RepID=UPI00370D917E